MVFFFFRFNVFPRYCDNQDCRKKGQFYVDKHFIFVKDEITFFFSKKISFRVKTRSIYSLTHTAHTHTQREWRL